MIARLTLLLIALAPQAPNVRSQDFREGRVTRIEGATRLEITPNGEREAIKVTIAHLVSPERGQEGYAEAEKLAARLLANRTIKYNIVRIGPIRQGRTPAVIHIGPSDDYGRHLVQAGWAWRAEPQKSTYEKEEQTAKEEGRGLWAAKKKK